MPFVWDPNKRSKRARHQKHPIVCLSRFNKPIQIFIMCDNGAQPARQPGSQSASNDNWQQSQRQQPKWNGKEERDEKKKYSNTIDKQILSKKIHTRRENYAKRCQQTHKRLLHFRNECGQHSYVRVYFQIIFVYVFLSFVLNSVLFCHNFFLCFLLFALVE